MKNLIGGILVAIAGFSAIVWGLLLMGLIWSIPLMLLWDWLMPELFGLSEITLFQAFGINILSGILFGSKSTSGTKKETKKETKSILHG